MVGCVMRCRQPVCDDAQVDPSADIANINPKRLHHSLPEIHLCFEVPISYYQLKTDHAYKSTETG